MSCGITNYREFLWANFNQHFGPPRPSRTKPARLKLWRRLELMENFRVIKLWRQHQALAQPAPRIGEWN